MDIFTRPGREGHLFLLGTPPKKTTILFQHFSTPGTDALQMLAHLP
ncbi:MAG: hypothetical protein KKD96_10365 [Proteobacteria bacterium]|nr:hypothetical protein [Pseudomonadota bacterium]